jgi:APA family basic amino acid/polyamine antiporter
MDYTEASALSKNIEPGDTAQMPAKPTLLRGMSLGDAVLLLVGGTIGSGLFLTSSDVAASTRTPLLFMSAWVVGGIVAILACYSVAELGSMFPQAGGQYIYLREAYGEFVAFLYGWMIFSVNVTGSIAAIAAGFAAYAGAVFSPLRAVRPVLSIGVWTLNVGHLVAIGAIIFLTWINVVGLRRAVVLQNIATWAKFAAIGGFLVFGFAFGHGHWSNLTAPIPGHVSAQALMSGFGVALIAVFWVYDGWVYITWVAGEVKQPERNVPRSLLYGVGTVAATVLLINLLYLYAMPMATMAEQPTVGESAAKMLFFPAAGQWLSALVAIACFGAAASCILSGARVYYAMAADGIFFQKLAEVHPRWRTPAFSLIVQGVWSCALVLTGRYDQLFTYVMFVSVIAYAAAASSIFVLRRRRPDMPRPYRCPGYPWVPLAYCVICGAWALNALWSKPMESLAGVGIMLIGAPAYFYWRREKRAAASAQRLT